MKSSEHQTAQRQHPVTIADMCRGFHSCQLIFTYLILCQK